MDGVALAAGFGCSFCGLFIDVAKSRCGCSLQSDLDKSSEKVHPCLALHGQFVGRVLNVVTFDWACRSTIEADLEFVVSEGKLFPG